MLKLSKIIFEFFDRSQEQILTYTIEQDLVKKKQDPVQLFIYRKKKQFEKPRTQITFKIAPRSKK